MRVARHASRRVTPLRGIPREQWSYTYSTRRVMCVRWTTDRWADSKYTPLACVSTTSVNPSIALVSYCWKDTSMWNSSQKRQKFLKVIIPSRFINALETIDLTLCGLFLDWEPLRKRYYQVANCQSREFDRSLGDQLLLPSRFKKLKDNWKRGNPVTQAVWLIKIGLIRNSFATC